MSLSPPAVCILRLGVRTLLVALTLLWLSFALLSGAAEYGDGIGAVVRNLPNALPWLALFIVVYIAFRWELLGGILIVVAGIFSVVFFNAVTTPIVLLAVSLPLVTLGSALILCWFLDRRQTP